MRKKLLLLTIFSLAFAFIEATAGVYLQQILPINELRKLPYPPSPTILTLPFIAFLKSAQAPLSSHPFSSIERGRELATLIVLLSLAYIWGRSVVERALAFVFAFSVWDLGYYLFLNQTLGWPQTLWDIDVFFLIPVPWVGPVIFPIVVFTVLGLVSGTSLYLLKFPPENKP